MGIVSVWDDEKVLKIDGSNGCITIWMYLSHWIIYSKTVKMVSFMLCIFYHNTKLMLF